MNFCHCGFVNKAIFTFAIAGAIVVAIAVAIAVVIAGVNGHDSVVVGCGDGGALLLRRQGWQQ